MPRTILLTLIALSLAAGPAFAQCSIAAYGDPAGTASVVYPQINVWGDTFSIYVVIFAEDTVAAAAYRIHIDGLGTTVFVWDLRIGPSGEGLVIEEETGSNAALAECVYGFGGAPVLVAEYILQPLPWFYPAYPFATIEANTNQGDTPVYVTCQDEIRPCAPGPDLYVPVPNETTSFGLIKSLYLH